MAIEYELKYRADNAVLDAINASRIEAPTVYRMHTTYYDTANHALSQRHITLRKRMENETAVCTLKAPAKQGRKEFEVECDSIQDAIPVLCKLSGLLELPVLLAGGVVPVCGARFTRLARTVLWGGATLELALDRGMLTGGGREAPLCEVEVELKEGTPETAAAFARELERSFGLEPENRSKFKRAYALSREDEHGI